MAGARIFAEEVTQQAASATGGDGHLSGWKSLGSADVAVSGGAGSASVTATGGLWRVLEQGTDAHDVVAHRRALSTPYGPRKRVHVRGRRALNTWTRGARLAKAQVEQATAAALSRMGG